MRSLGMIDGAVEPQSDLAGSGGTYRLVNFRPRKSGLVSTRVAGGQYVEPGQVLIGTILEPHPRETLWTQVRRPAA
jgi:hypothetical protein